MSDSLVTSDENLPPGEVIYRRIAESNAKDWIKGGKVSAYAFLPNKGDSDGLSLTRAASAREAAETGRAGKRFYVVPLLVADIAKHSAIKLIADSATHALIVAWTLTTRDSNAVREGADYLAAHCGAPQGPFEGKS